MVGFGGFGVFKVSSNLKPVFLKQVGRPVIPYHEPHLERGHIVIVDTKLNKRIWTDK